MHRCDIGVFKFPPWGDTPIHLSLTQLEPVLNMLQIGKDSRWGRHTLRHWVLEPPSCIAHQRPGSLAAELSMKMFFGASSGATAISGLKGGFVVVYWWCASGWQRFENRNVYVLCRSNTTKTTTSQRLLGSKTVRTMCPKETSISGCENMDFGLCQRMRSSRNDCEVNSKSILWCNWNEIFQESNSQTNFPHVIRWISNEYVAM